MIYLFFYLFFSSLKLQIVGTTKDEDGYSSDDESVTEIVFESLHPISIDRRLSGMSAFLYLPFRDFACFFLFLLGGLSFFSSQRSIKPILKT